MIEFQYFEGCPNAKETLGNLISVKNEFDIDDKEIIITEVPNIDFAEKFNFQGSPTILIDGKDIYTGIEPRSYNYSCRIYIFNKKQTGIIPIDFIKEYFLKYYKLIN